MRMLLRILPITFFAMNLCAADTKSEIAQLVESLNRAASARDADGYVKLMTNDFHSITRSGVVRDRQATYTFIKSVAPPADLKIEEISTSIYGDTVIRITRDSGTGTNGAKIQTCVSQVFVKQNGVWKLALRSAAPIAPQDQK
jgi:ketosteroid isomerase-like protein